MKIREAGKSGNRADGVTTNHPHLCREEGDVGLKEHIAAICRSFPARFSAEVTSEATEGTGSRRAVSTARFRQRSGGLNVPSRAHG